MVDFGKELCEPARRNGDSRSLEGSLELALFKFAVMVVIYGFEEEKELTLGRLDKGAEFCML